MIDGKPVPRGQDAAGLLLYDATGVERGGYVTFAPSGNVVLTLDTRERQVALFAADPTDGVVARLWSPDGSNWVQMRAATEGTRFSAGREGRVVLQQPALTEEDAQAFCSAFRSELEALDPQPPEADVMAACTRQMPPEVCRPCLAAAP